MTQFFSTTVFCMLFTLVLIYGTVFESKYNIGPKVRYAFLYMLISATIVNLSDILIYIFNGKLGMYWWLKIFIAVYFAGTFFTMCFFSIFLYRYISFRQEISKNAFRFSFLVKMIAIILSLVACSMDRLYAFDNSAYVKGEFYVLYLMGCVLMTIIDFGIIINYGKMLGKHDIIAFSSYIFLPLIGATVGLMGSDKNLIYPLLTVSFLIMYVMIHAEQERLYSHISNQDQLTGLNNRRAFEALKEHEGEYDKIGVVFIDINGLKYTNDNYGHAAGDALICNVAQILGKCFRQNELYRIGGDEFVAVMPGISESALEHRTEKLRDMLKENEAPLAAVGVAYCKDGEGDAVFKLAEKRMYEEKEEQHEKFPVYVRI